MIDDVERLRRIAAWSRESARVLSPARPPPSGRAHRCVIGSGDLLVVLDGLERIGPELSALATRLETVAHGGRPPLRPTGKAGGP